MWFTSFHVVLSPFVQASCWIELFCMYLVNSVFVVSHGIKTKSRKQNKINKNDMNKEEVQQS